MGYHKTHQRVEKHKLYSHKSNKEVFSENRHNILYLSEILITNSNLRGSHLTPRQKFALDDFRKIGSFGLCDGNKRYPRSDILKACFFLFDELFFFGSLRSRCEFHCSTKVVQQNRVGLTGITRKRNKKFRPWELFQKSEKQMFDITIFTSSLEQRQRYQCHELLGYVGIVLHEMIHAFLLCWGCDYAGCSDANDRLGKDHGPIWQDIAYALERAARDPKFLNLDVRLSRVSALAAELHGTGRSPQSIGRSGLARWDITETDLWDRYRGIAEIGGAAGANKIVKGG